MALPVINFPLAPSLRFLAAPGVLRTETLLTGDNSILLPNATGRFDFIEMDQASGRLLAAHTAYGEGRQSFIQQSK